MTPDRKAPLDRNDPEIRDCLAAEYALGTLRGPARTRFERWLRQDADLARAVERWEHHFAVLDEELPAEEPPAAVWEGVQARLAQAGGTAPGGSAAPAPGRAPWSGHLWNSLNFWRGLAAAAVLLAVVAGLSGGGAPEAPARMVVVTDDRSRPVWVVSTPEQGRTVRVRTLRSPGMGPEKVCPLWLRGPQGQTRLVGILPEERGAHTLELPREVPGPRAGSRVAVTVEKAARMPAARPAGKVVFEGEWIPL